MPPIQWVLGLCTQPAPCSPREPHWGPDPAYRCTGDTTQCSAAGEAVLLKAPVWGCADIIEATGNKTCHYRGQGHIRSCEGKAKNPNKTQNIQKALTKHMLTVGLDFQGCSPCSCHPGRIRGTSWPCWAGPAAGTSGTRESQLPSATSLCLCRTLPVQGTAMKCC